jgi:hypothetical protein
MYYYDGWNPLPLVGGTNSVETYGTFRWNYAFYSTNHVADVSSFADGLRRFASHGFGYEPDSVSVTFRNGGAGRIEVEGVVPLRLGRKPEAGKKE